jgi:putative DNA primase/helicase|tara:strand:- start:1500 stop:4016 length:2517 start_codon:yes stop_codon:yes gene_type:complete
MTFTDLLSQLTDVRPEGGSYLARCPAHTDGHPSLLLTLEPSGRLLLYCRAGCRIQTVVDALGMNMADLFDMEPGDGAVTSTAGAKAAPSHDHLEAIGRYVEAANALYRGSPAAEYASTRFGIDEDLGYFIGLGYDEGDGAFEYLTTPYRRAPRLVVPFHDFLGIVQGLQGRALVDDPTKWCGPRNPEGHAWSTMGVTDLEGDERNVLVTEGPGDRLTAVGAGYSAVGIRGAALARNTDTVNILSGNLHGRRIVLCGDNDESGIDFNLSMGQALASHGHQVHTLTIQEGNDLSDWRAADPEGFGDALRRGLRAATRIDANMAPPGPPPDDDGDDDIPVIPDYFPHTDEGNAHRLMSLVGDLARWCPELGWVLFHEGAWNRDTAKQIKNAVAVVCALMRQTGAAMEEHGEATGDPDLVDDGIRLSVWARRSENSPRFGNAILHSEPKAAIDFDEFDQHDHLLVVANGTVDLRSGEVLEHSPDHLLTHKIEHNYDPETDCPRWRQFLLEIMDGSTDLVAYLQRLVGYSLTGSTREQAFAVLYGTGANGKSVFTNTLATVFGDIVGVASFAAFELKGPGASTADLASLRGKRLVIAQEGERSRPMAEAVLKRATGGDPITCRHLYQSEFTFVPNFTLLLATNYRPKFLGQDDGLWRRVKLIPFARYFTDAERDHYLGEKLEAEAEGILAWAIEGAIDWYRDGLGDPPAVVEATSDYKATSDDLAGFCEWEVVSDPDAEIKGTALYGAYRDWASREGVKEWSSRALHEAVVERMPGVSKKKKNDGVWLTGLRLSSPADRGSDEVTHGDGGLQTPLFTDFDSLRGVSKTASPPVTSSLDEGGAA